MLLRASFLYPPSAGGPMRRWALAAALPALLAAVGCAVHRTPGTPAPEPLRVEVENHNRADINLFVDRGSSRIRVGMVVAGDERRFTLHNYPSLPLNHLLFQVERIGVERTV